ncbi:MAG: type II toxin-antitoxin system HicA family toxin [Synergistaceae bacterium]|jgi:predicted RNA binding protein YcfA (HicA-like mRNA interferase family)|nr:type II toxin-antitoxin system HicA family toxin [Synergistaceae bacterium]
MRINPKEVGDINQEDVIRILERHGWVSTGRGKGSHKVLFDPATKRITTVPKPKNKDIPTGTLSKIRQQTGIDEIK